MTLILSNDDVERLLTMPDCIEALEAAYLELADGQAKRRGSDAEVTCFLNNLGLGYQFAAVGSVIYRRAKEQNLGIGLPTDWFTETVHP
jgi:hypothetical protein